MPDFTQLRTTMVDTQVRPSDVTKFPVIEAMLSVPREAYVPVAKRDAAYAGGDIEIAPGRVVLDPRVLAKMLDALNIRPDDLVLDIGAGLGYSTAVIAHMAEAVIAVEENEDLAEQCSVTLGEQGVDNAVVETGALSQGAAQHGPYDAIILQGGAVQIPVTITDQLKEGGRIGCIFLDGALGIAKVGHKTDGQINWRMSFNATAPVLPGFEGESAFVL